MSWTKDCQAEKWHYQATAIDAVQKMVPETRNSTWKQSVSNAIIELFKVNYSVLSCFGVAVQVLWRKHGHASFRCFACCFQCCSKSSAGESSCAGMAFCTVSLSGGSCLSVSSSPFAASVRCHLNHPFLLESTAESLELCNVDKTYAADWRWNIYGSGSCSLSESQKVPEDLYKLPRSHNRERDLNP